MTGDSKSVPVPVKARPLLKGGITPKWYPCPACGHVLDNWIRETECPECGQALDWSGNERAG